MRRVEHPPGGSTLITSAPKSANILPHNAPFSSVKSSSRNPLSNSDGIDEQTSRISEVYILLRQRCNGLASELFLLAGVARGADRGREIGVLGDDETPAERKGEALHFLHESEQARELAREHD